MEDFYQRKDIDKETVEITIRIPKDSFKKSYETLLGQELSNTKVKGFRKGKVPSDLVEPEIKESMKVQAFEKLVPYYLTTALQKEDLSPIAPPSYKNLPNFSKDEDIEFVVDITVMPEFKLGNLKKIKVKKEKAEVTQKEVDDAIENVFKNNKTTAKSISDKWAKEISKTLKIENIKTLDDLKKYVTETLTKQKEIVVKRQMEDSAFQEAIKLSNIEIPQKAIEYEAYEREHSFGHDMEDRNIKVEDFLKANNITMEKMRELWLKDAKQALESDVFLKLYAKEKDIKVTDEELKENIEKIKKGAPANTDSKVFEDEQWREYVRRVEQKEKAFKVFIDEVLGE